MMLVFLFERITSSEMIPEVISYDSIRGLPRHGAWKEVAIAAEIEPAADEGVGNLA